VFDAIRSDEHHIRLQCARPFGKSLGVTPIADTVDTLDLREDVNEPVPQYLVVDDDRSADLRHVCQMRSAHVSSRPARRRAVADGC
jgi:hypothetical protein